MAGADEGGGAGVVRAGADGTAGCAAGVGATGVDGAAAVVDVGAAVGVCRAVDLTLTTGTFGVGLTVAATGLDDEDEELAFAAAPITNTSPQNTRNPVSTLCLAAHGFRRSGPPGTPPGDCGGGYPCQ